MCQKAIVTDHNIQKICRQGSIPQVLHTLRINLSPFTKDFRVWVAHIEITFISSMTDFFGRQSTKFRSSININNRFGKHKLFKNIAKVA